MDTKKNVEQIYLAHYGIKGQKWGVRRYQNTDGSLTSEGKARAKKEYKADNKEAFEKGKVATVYARASEKATKEYNRFQNKYEKNPTEKNKVLLEAHKRAKNELNKASKDSLDTVNKHREQLIKKYGKEAVSDIKFNKSGAINERIASNEQIASCVGLSLSMIGFSMAAGSPVTFIVTPRSPKSLGNEIYDKTYINVVRDMRTKGEWYK